VQYQGIFLGKLLALNPPFFAPDFFQSGFLGSHFGFLRLFAAPKRRLVCAIHLARRSRLASGRFAEARTLDDERTV
jgi:hypothetical protein